MKRVLALDIGGANLKAAHSDGAARSQSLAVWRNPAVLDAAISGLILPMPSFDVLAVTMTAELCDCFDAKAQGVSAVLDAVESAVQRVNWAGPICVWLTDGGLVPLSIARAEPLKAAASNWLALATWAGRLCREGPALVIDIGSTTSDLIPLEDGVPIPRGRTDLERLGFGELVYSGVRRTPVCALVRTVIVRDRPVRVAAELFATTLDANLWLDKLPEDPNDCGTADGRPATRQHARARLARVVCADSSMLADADISEIARQIVAAQLSDLRGAREQVEATLGQAPRIVVLAGSGEFLARRIVKPADPGRAQVISLNERLGPSLSSAACAYALAVIASEQQIQ